MCNDAHPWFIRLTRFHTVAENRHDDVIMTRWKYVLLKETPKITQKHSNNMEVLNANEQYEIEKRKNNIVIRGMQENETGNALSLGENITKFFEDHFAM